MLALTLALYWPTLDGGWIFDDWPNLAGLANLAGGEAVEFWRYVMSGSAGPTGRPLALLTFALQSDAWPDQPAAFHAVNLALHLACGVALALLGRAIARRWWPERPMVADWVAVAAAGLWLVHPLNLSTTAYVVQRMAQLATLFTLLALLAWTEGRARVERAPLARGGWWLAAAGLIAGGLAAVLSKETGVLLLAYALVLERWVFARTATPRGWDRLRAVLLVAPALAFLALVAWRFEDLSGRALLVREFTLPERLLSQPRALVEYFGLIAWPTPGRLTLFNDHFAVSRGLLEPWTTLPALLLVLGAAAWAWRRRAEPLAFGLAWFLGGHLLESTILPLELYFEHRNYLPMFGPLLAAAHLGARAWDRAPSGRVRRFALGGAVAAALALGAVTWSQARLWAEPLRLVATWAARHPDSVRAQGTLLGMLKGAGVREPLVAEYRAATARFPRVASLWLDWTELACLAPAIERPPLATVVAALETARPDYSAIAVLDRMVTAVERDGSCGGLPALEIAVHLGALLGNPRYAPFEATLHLLRGRLAAAVGDHAQAAHDLDRAYALKPGVDVAVARLRAALRSGDAPRVLAALADARADAARQPLRGRFYQAELDRWRERLRAAGQPVD